MVLIPMILQQFDQVIILLLSATITIDTATTDATTTDEVTVLLPMLLLQ